jgi:hypothetical protein
VLKKLKYEKIHGPNISPSVIRANRPRRMRFAGHAAQMGKRRNR